MLTEQRFEIILDMIKKDGSVTVTDLKEILGASESTIRRDLNELDKAGKLSKVFGGAVALDNVFTSEELSVSQKAEVNVEQKRTIARYAATLVKPRDTVFIDAGTTTELMIDFLTEREATYVTNAVVHARKLALAGFKTVLIGGELKGTTEAVVGNQAVMSIQHFNFNKGFFGTNGVSAKCGFTTPDINEAVVKETALNRCLDRFVLADGDKFGEVSSVTFAKIGDAIVLTDKKPNGHFVKLENVRVC